jgi:hypothetical protein
MAVAAARTGSVGGVLFGAVAVWSENEIVHQSVNCGSVFGGGWHLVGYCSSTARVCVSLGW